MDPVEIPLFALFVSGVYLIQLYDDPLFSNVAVAATLISARRNGPYRNANGIVSCDI